MAGYPIAAPLNLAGPWGTAAWVVVGTGLTLLSVVGLVKLTESVETTTKTTTRTDTCEKCPRYGARVHAQGADCGGETSSTIGAPGITQATPILVVQGLGLSAATKLLLTRRQLASRAAVIIKAENYIVTGPTVGGRFGKKSFAVLGVAGGIRYDVDCFGSGPSFIG